MASSQTSADEGDITLPAALTKWVAQQPEKRLWTYLDDAGRETGDSVTYRQLEERTRELGRSLLNGAQGRKALRPGDRVLLVYPPSLHFVLAFVACLRAGLVAVPVYPPDPRKLRKDIQAFSKTVASCGATSALTSSAYDHVKKASAIKARLTRDDSRWPDGLQWLVTDRALPERKSPAAVADEAFVDGALGSGVGRDSLAFLQYTSGSTGDPKGVKITHGNLAHNLGAIIRELKAGEGTVVVSWLPQYHDMGLIGSLLGSLYCGGSGYYMSPLDFVRSPPTWLTSAAKYRATHLQAPNFAFALAARKWKALKAQPALDLSSVVHLINAAEPIDASSIEAFEETFGKHGLREGVIKPTYGLAEHTVFVCSGGEQRLTVDRHALEVDKKVKVASNAGTTGEGGSSVDDPRHSSDTSMPPPELCVLVGCGYPSRVRSLELLVVEPSSKRPLAEDHVGEVWIRSPSKAHGYWGLPQRSAEAFCAVPAAAGGGGEIEPTVDQSPAGSEGMLDDISPSDTDALASSGEGGRSVAAELHSEAEALASGEDGTREQDYSRGFLRTGDEGFLHRGELFICGRIKDLIIIGGRNHYPQDVERTAERDRNELIRPGCSSAFSVPGPEGEGGELLVLALELREEQVKVSRERRQQLAEDIRSSVVSEHGVDVQHLLLLAPRANVKTTSGKIARQWCRRAFLDGKMKPLVHLKSGTAAPSDEGHMPTGADGVGADLVGAGLGADTNAKDSGSKATADPSTMSDEQLLAKLREAVASIGGGSLADPEAPFYTLGLSSMAVAQFSGLLEQEYGARIPLAMLDADDTTLRSLVPIVKASGVERVDTAQGPPNANTASAAAASGGAVSSQTMVRDSPSGCEETITNSCPCCLCLLSCPCCR